MMPTFGANVNISKQPLLILTYLTEFFFFISYIIVGYAYKTIIVLVIRYIIININV